LEQENVDLVSLEPLNGQLLRLVHHKDKGVLAFVSCLLADILRLYAPNAPFNANELAVIFVAI
jgi:sister-chromatid-cohesion protein PDS5